MDSNSIPYSPPLNGLDSPHIFDSEMTDSMQETDLFFNSAFTVDPTAQLLRDESLANSTFQSSMQTKLQNPASSGIVRDRTMPSTSPENSTQDSSSDTSAYHERKTSSRSSQSGLSGTDIVMADASQPTFGRTTNFVKREAMTEYPRPMTRNFDSFEYSNRAMENDFDFDSAASSPSPYLPANTVPYTGPRHVAIPFTESPRAFVNQLSNPVPSSTVST